MTFRVVTTIIFQLLFNSTLPFFLKNKHLQLSNAYFRLATNIIAKLQLTIKELTQTRNTHQSNKCKGMLWLFGFNRLGLTFLISRDSFILKRKSFLALPIISKESRVPQHWGDWLMWFKTVVLLEILGLYAYLFPVL